MKEMMKKKGRIIMVPYPAQGHVSPMQKLASAFVSEGLEAVIVLPQYMHRQIREHEEEGIKWVAVEDGLEEEEEAPDFFGIERAMEKCMPPHLEDMLLLAQDEVVCVVVDLLASWAIPVAARCAIPTAGFWPAMFATYRLIQSIPHMLRTRLISHSGLPQGEGKIRLAPDLPVISTEELPWLIGTVASKKGRFKFWMRTLERSRSLKWLLVNSFPEESKREMEVEEQRNEVGNMNKYPRVLPISPMSRQQQRKSVSLWEEDMSCLKWLQSQEDGSVVYVSFGSWVGPIGEAKVKSLALALEACGRPFIWVLRDNWREGLPLGFVERAFMQGRGIVVSWAPQTDILRHESVGYYLTHCGWNSTMEALQFRKRLLCFPVAGDQFLNCAFIVQVWRVGIRLSDLCLKDLQEGLSTLMHDDHIDARLLNLHHTIMGLRGDRDNPRGPLFDLKPFLHDLNQSPPSAILHNST